MRRPLTFTKMSLNHFSKQVAASMTLLCAIAWLAPSTAAAPWPYTVKPFAQKKIKELPAGPLYWRVETFATLADAKAAVGPDGWNPASVRYETTTSLIVEVVGKVWVLTLGPMDASPPGESKLAPIGLVPSVPSPAYLLRVNQGSGPPRSETPVQVFKSGSTDLTTLIMFVVDATKPFSEPAAITLARPG